MSVVAVVGLGYVGLPLAVEFGKRQRTIGFDLSRAKIENYRSFVDPTGAAKTSGGAGLTVVGSAVAPALRLRSLRLMCFTPMDHGTAASNGHPRRRPASAI